MYNEIYTWVVLIQNNKFYVDYFVAKCVQVNE